MSADTKPEILVPLMDGKQTLVSRVWASFMIAYLTCELCSQCDGFYSPCGKHAEEFDLQNK